MPLEHAMNIEHCCRRLMSVRNPGSLLIIGMMFVDRSPVSVDLPEFTLDVSTATVA